MTGEGLVIPRLNLKGKQGSRQIGVYLMAPRSPEHVPYQTIYLPLIPYTQLSSRRDRQSIPPHHFTRCLSLLSPSHPSFNSSGNVGSLVCLPPLHPYSVERVSDISCSLCVRVCVCVPLSILADFKAGFRKWV